MQEAPDAEEEEVGDGEGRDGDLGEAGEALRHEGGDLFVPRQTGTASPTECPALDRVRNKQAHWVQLLVVVGNFII